MNEINNEKLQDIVDSINETVKWMNDSLIAQDVNEVNKRIVDIHNLIEEYRSEGGQ